MSDQPGEAARPKKRRLLRAGGRGGAVVILAVAVDVQPETSFEGDPNGQGVMTWPSGQRYAGEYKDGAMHGQGVMTMPDGTRYEVGG